MNKKAIVGLVFLLFVLIITPFEAEWLGYKTGDMLIANLLEYCLFGMGFILGVIVK